MNKTPLPQSRRDAIKDKLAGAKHPKSDVLSYQDLKHLSQKDRDAVFEARVKRERRANRK